MHRIGLGVPRKSNRRRTAAVEDCDPGVRIEGHSRAGPVDVLTVVVEPSPLPSGLAINEARRERLGAPIALLNDAHLDAVWRDSPSDDSRRTDMTNKDRDPNNEG